MANRENKLIAFFRSRSREQQQTLTPPTTYLKSTSVRSQNRPISSTTTATHSTITPLPSQPLRYRPILARHPYPDPPPDDDSDDNPFPRSETPSSTRQKLPWHALFSRSSSSSISHSISDRKGSTSTCTSDQKPSSRKRSFRFTSRPSTPKSVDSCSSKSPFSIPVPSNPLPLSASPRRRSFGLGSSQRTTPKSSTGHLPLPTTSQPVKAHARRHSVASERPPHDSAVALPEDSAHRSQHNPPDTGTRTKGKEREIPIPDAGRPVPPSFDFPSQSLPNDPSLLSPNHTLPRLPTIDSASPEKDNPSSHRLHAIPRIIQTPPTPQRPGDPDSPSIPTLDSTKIQVAKPKSAIAMPHREHVLVSSSTSHSPSPKARFTPRFLSGRDIPKTKDGTGLKSSKRPPVVSSDKTPRNMTSHRGKLGSFDFERPISALNRSNSTADRRRNQVHPLEHTLSEESAHGAKPRIHPAQPDTSVTPQLKPDHTGETSVISFSSISLQTNAESSTPPGQSASWGRASGRRVLRTSHGTFAFEHPSSLPNSPNPHTFNLPNEPHQNDISDHIARSQPTTPLHGKHHRGQSYNTPDHVDPSRTNSAERKPKGKGRSLDLGLGLSWAPSRLREEVLMPGLMLAREKAKLDRNKANGSDVTRAFQSLLSESRFQTFKKYVRSFDAHIIPLEGPSGLLASVEKLLADSGLSERERKKLMSEFTVFVQSHSG